jgi:hypothetical protein
MIKKQILDRLSRYEIKIHGVDLKKNYEIFIDRESCGKFSGSRLAEGVNLTSRAGSVTKQNRMILYFIDESREIYLTRWRRIQISEFPVKYNEQICQEYKDRALKKMDESIEVLDQALRWLSKPKPRHFVIKEL